MFGSIDMDRFVLGEIKDESVSANCRPQAMTAADWYEWSPVYRGEFYLSMRQSVNRTIAGKVDLPLLQHWTHSRPVK